jgi:molybdate-binding protein
MASMGNALERARESRGRRWVRSNRRADAYGLDFIAYRDECYDLVFMEHEAESMSIKAMFDALSSRRFVREIGQLCGYDTAQMGTGYPHLI